MSNSFSNFLGSLKEKNNSEILLLNLHSLILEFNNFSSSNQLSKISSTHLHSFYSLLEDRDRRIRKASLTLLCLILRNPEAKMEFLKKFGMTQIPSKIPITRMKYLSNEIDVAELIASLKKPSAPSKGSLCWFLPYFARNFNVSETSPIEYLEIYQLFDRTGAVSLELVPDPITNMCGIELLPEDVQTKISKSFLEEEPSFIGMTSTISISKQDEGKKVQRNFKIKYITESRKTDNFPANLSFKKLVKRKPFKREEMSTTRSPGNSMPGSFVAGSAELKSSFNELSNSKRLKADSKIRRNSERNAEDIYQRKALLDMSPINKLPSIKLNKVPFPSSNAIPKQSSNIRPLSKNKTNPEKKIQPPTTTSNLGHSLVPARPSISKPMIPFSGLARPVSISSHKMKKDSAVNSQNFPKKFLTNRESEILKLSRNSTPMRDFKIRKNVTDTSIKPKSVPQNGRQNSFSKPRPAVNQQTKRESFLNFQSMKPKVAKPTPVNKERTSWVVSRQSPKKLLSSRL